MTAEDPSRVSVLELVGVRRRSTTDARRVAMSGGEPDRSDPNGSSVDSLMARTGAGDVAAFAGLFDLVGPRVFGVVRSVVRDPARSEDVVQEIMIELWRVAPNCDVSRGTTTAWILSIAHRRAVDCVRNEESRRSREDRYGRNEHVLRRSEGDPPTVAIARDGSRDVRAVLTSLTAEQRRPIELAYYEGLTYAEIAAHLDLPLGTVKSRVRAGLARLRSELCGSSPEL